MFPGSREAVNHTGWQSVFVDLQQVHHFRMSISIMKKQRLPSVTDHLQLLSEQKEEWKQL